MTPAEFRSLTESYLKQERVAMKQHLAFWKRFYETFPDALLCRIIHDEVLIPDTSRGREMFAWLEKEWLTEALDKLPDFAAFCPQYQSSR